MPPGRHSTKFWTEITLTRGPAREFGLRAKEKVQLLLLIGVELRYTQKPYEDPTLATGWR